MNKISSYRDLTVWQDAMVLVEDCYRLAAAFPRDEIYGMTAQIRRAAVSVPANISEGYGRGITGSYVQFLKIARGSLCELETHLLLAVRLRLSEPGMADPLRAKRDAIGRMLHSLIESVQRNAVR